MTTTKEENLNARLREIRDGYVKNSFNYTTALAISKIHVGGYLQALFDFGFITKEEYDVMTQEWV